MKKKGSLWKYQLVLVAWAFINVCDTFLLSIKTTQHISLIGGMTKPHFSDMFLILSLLIKPLRAKVKECMLLALFHSASATEKLGCIYRLGSATMMCKNRESWQSASQHANDCHYTALNKNKPSCWRLTSYFPKPVNSWDASITFLCGKVLRFVFSADGTRV